MIKIVQKENKVLRERAKPLSTKDIGSKEVKAIIEKMTKALWGSKNGVAIAAPQIGVSFRIFLVEASVFDKQGFTDEEKNKKRIPVVFINPKISKVSKKKLPVPEGCLSVDGIFGVVERADKLTVEAYNENGKKFTRGASGFLAQIIQHECDHLEGVLFIDKARNLEKVKKEPEASTGSTVLK